MGRNPDFDLLTPLSVDHAFVFIAQADFLSSHGQTDRHYWCVPPFGEGLEAHHSL